MQDLKYLIQPDETSGIHSRVFALSDIHVDMQQNMDWLRSLSATDYKADTLILAGDVSDRISVLEYALAYLATVFAQVCFVPGNHELWVRKREAADSIAKFWRIRRLCKAIGVHTSPVKVGNDNQAVWIVPLFSWYVKPEEGPGSLFVDKPGEDPTLAMWSDNYFTRWPEVPASHSVADYFLQLNECYIARAYDAPVISFSHFVPRVELIYSTRKERQASGRVINQDPHPQFNFSRVAGCTYIDTQIRRLGSIAHVYGHQHRNRNRLIEGVRYISNCLGYPRERYRNHTHGAGDQPALIWSNTEELDK
jgi:Calcineurin-like phosphoesterase